MEAVVTMKATPAQFDLMREAVATAKEACQAKADDRDVTPEQRRDARAKAVELGTLETKLR